MTYDIQTTYNSFGGGISDDTFIGQVNSVQDMDWIEVQTEERYAQCDFWYYPIQDVTYTWWAVWFKKTPAWNFASNTWSVTLSAGASISGLDWYAMDYYGTWATQINYFFGTSTIFKRNYDGSTSAWSVTGAIWGELGMVTWWHQLNLLFSKQNTIYYIDTNTDTVFTAWSLTKWSVVKCIYPISSSSIVIVATNGGNTQFYEATFTGSTYDIVPTLTEVGRDCVGAVGNKYSVYWADNEWIHEYQGRQSQMVKYLTGILWITFYKKVIVRTSTAIYEFGSKKPWRYSILTKTSQVSTLIDRDLVLYNLWGWFKIYKKSSGYRRANIIMLRPLDWGNFSVPKHDLNYRFWIINPEWAPTAEAEKCWIKIEVQTDEMEKDIGSSFVTVYEAYEDFAWFIEIPPFNVATALEWANRKSEFWYATTRITLYAGSEIGVTDIYEKTPKLFDFTIMANYVKR